LSRVENESPKSGWNGMSRDPTQQTDVCPQITVAPARETIEPDNVVNRHPAPEGTLLLVEEHASIDKLNRVGARLAEIT